MNSPLKSICRIIHSDAFLPPNKQPKPGAKPSPLDENNSFNVGVSGMDQGGKERSLFPEEWIFNSATEKTAAQQLFAYAGSPHNDNRLYPAQVEGSIIALFTDPLAMANNPRTGSAPDEIWIVNLQVPPVKTKVPVNLLPRQKKNLRKPQ
jgi:hypothetical protein